MTVCGTTCYNNITNQIANTDVAESGEIFRV